MGLGAVVCQAPGSQSGQWVYAVGGTNTDVLAALAGYDTVGKKWSTLPSMPTARSAVAAATSPGRIHVLGGFNDSAVLLNTHEVYEPATNAWSTAAPLPSPRAALAAVTGSDGLIYAIGGADGNGPVSGVDAYDPTSDTWITKAPLNTARMWLAAVAGPGGLIYAIGGGGGTPVSLSSMEAFNITTNTWTTSSFPLPIATCGLAAAVDPSGLVCVIGGDTVPSGGPTSDVYCYNPADPGWITQPPMPTARGALAAATGPDGLIYAIGGADPANSFNTVAAFKADKCYPIEQKIAAVQSELSTVQGDIAELPPKDRAGAEKQIIALGLELKGLEAQLKACQGG
jgi:N-acetylneuraminic acid mutarotase